MKDFTTEPGTPERVAEVRARADDNVLTHGHTVRYIFGDPERPDFFYTVGRSLYGHPELLLTGNFDPALGQLILNETANAENSGLLDLLELADSGEEFQLEGFGCPFRVVRADPLAANMTGAQVLAHDPDVACVQVLLPDNQMRFPDDPASDYHDIQPIYALEA